MSTVTRPQQTQPHTSPRRHHERLKDLRELERQQRWLTVAAMILSVFVTAAGILGLLDYFLELTVSQRLLGWCLIGAVLAASLWLLRSWLHFESGDAACAAEHAWPELGQRLRTSDDYAHHPESVATADPGLLSALEQDADERMSDRDVEPLVRSWPLYALAGTCAAVALAWTFGLLTAPEWRISTARLALLPIQYTDVKVQPLPEMIAQGEKLPVRLSVFGRPLKSAEVSIRATGDNEWQDMLLTHTDAEAGNELVGDLLAVISGQERDYEVRIQAGSIDEVHPVAVRIPLVLEGWHAKVTPPAYTGLPETEGAAEGLRIPEGATLHLTARYNRPPQQVDLAAADSVLSEHASPQIQDRSVVLSLLAGREPIDLTLMARATDGMADESTLSIEVIPDQPPQLRFNDPAETSEALPTAEVQFALEARDDYGLTATGIRYRIDDGEEQTLWDVSPDAATSELMETVTLPLEELPLQYPQAITYYAFAIDNRQAGAEEVTSELRFLDIRPFARAYEFQESNCSGNCQGECLSLEKLIKSQRSILGRTFAAARANETAQSLAETLSTEEGELKEKTDALASALEAKVGPMPEMHAASALMAAATASLSGLDLADGQSNEERALASLIAARRNLRNILKQCNSQSQMCRNVDQQQMDKLRKPQRQQEQQQQQLNRLLDEITQLAKQQQSFCQSAQACSNPSSSLNAAKSQSSSQGTKPSSSSETTPQSEHQQSQGTEQKDSSSTDRQQTDVPTSPAAREETGEGENSSQQQRAALAQQQQESANRAREIGDELKPGQFGELAPQRMEQAAEAIEQSGQKFAAGGRDEESIRQAKEAADKLESLASHLGRRHGPNLDEKLAAARQQAERLAAEQRELSDSLTGAGRSEKDGEDESASGGSGAPQQEQQRQLAGRGQELADLVEQLQVDAAEEDWDLQRAMLQQSPTEQTQTAASAMSRAADQLADGKSAPARQEGKKAADLLSRFADGLANLEQLRGPARLAKLRAVEQQTADLLKSARRSGSAAEQALTRARSRELAQSLKPLASSDKELASATDHINDLAAANSNDQLTERPEERERQEGFATSQVTLAEGLRKLDEILQQRIQEAILSGALQQEDDAVPPGYVDMVEEYYRTLSEDVE